MPRKPGSVPSLSLWRATQVLARDQNLAQAFRERAAAQPKDSAFAKAYQARLNAADRNYTYDPLVPLLEALASISGTDGMLSGREWKKFGPDFDGLAHQLAEDAAQVKPLSGGRAFNELRNTPASFRLPPVDAKTRDKIFRTSETRVGLEQMPVLAQLAAEAERTQPLKGFRLFALQHLFTSTAGLFEAMEKAGIKVEESQVFGKDYSSHPEVVAYLRSKGWKVEEDYASVHAREVNGKIELYHPLKDALGLALERAAAENPPQKLLLLDEGGKLNRILHTWFPQFAHLCSVVEQTTNGLQNMEGVELLCPAVSVAGSRLKREVEGPIIGEDVAAATLETLEDIDPRLIAGKTVGIVGYGAVGRATAAAFASRGFQVLVTDINPAAEAQAQQDGAQRQSDEGEGKGSIAVVPRHQALGAGIVVGCTGRGAMTLEECRHLSDGAILVNAASGTHEFPVLETRAAIEQGARPALPLKEWEAFIQAAKEGRPHPYSPEQLHAFARGAHPELKNLRSQPSQEGEVVEWWALRTDHQFSFPTAAGSLSLAAAEFDAMPEYFFLHGDKRFMLLRGGTPINMDRDIPPKVIQLTRAMLFTGCLQAAGERTPGWKTFAPDTQARIEELWQQDQARLE